MLCGGTLAMTADHTLAPVVLDGESLTVEKAASVGRGQSARLQEDLILSRSKTAPRRKRRRI